MTLDEKLDRLLRCPRSYTRAELAVKLGVSYATIRYYETRALRKLK